MKNVNVPAYKLMLFSITYTTQAIIIIHVILPRGHLEFCNEFLTLRSAMNSNRDMGLLIKHKEF